MIKKFYVFLLICLTSYSLVAQAQFGQTLQINTNLRGIIGHPTWLIIVRDEASGAVFPYIFDVTENNNTWLVFTFARSYRVTVSNMKFGPYAIQNNFCGLEKGIINGQSMIISLTGVLSPNRHASKCKVIRYEGNMQYQ